MRRRTLSRSAVFRRNSRTATLCNPGDTSRHNPNLKYDNRSISKVSLPFCVTTSAILTHIAVESFKQEKDLYEQTHASAAPIAARRHADLGVFADRQRASSAAYILNFFPASDYNSNTAAMNAALGITGYQIDSFESTRLLPGLSISLSGGGIASPVTLTSLANLYNVSSNALSANNE